MIWQTITTASEETENLGRQLGKLLTPPILIELRSDLGGGKTTFTRGLAKGFGSRVSVTSPTFTLSNSYSSKASPWKIDHFDFYRLNDAGIMADELAESLQDKQTITVVEWGDIVADVLPKLRLMIEFKPVADNPEKRQIEFTYPTQLSNIISKLETQNSYIEPW